MREEKNKRKGRRGKGEAKWMGNMTGEEGKMRKEERKGEGRKG